MNTDAFKISTSDIDDVYRPIEIVAEASPGEVILTFTNMSEDDLTELGVYLEIASNVGDVDNPAQFAPHIDYQQVLTWGAEGTGGIDIYYPEDAVSGTTITRAVGASLSTKIPIGDLASNEEKSIKVVVNKPSGSEARRLFVNIAIG